MLQAKLDRGEDSEGESGASQSKASRHKRSHGDSGAGS